MFLIAIYLSFFFAALLRNAFEPDFEQSVLQRSRFGSNMMLIRLLIICLGFIIGILASGMSLSNFTIFLGALGVGIGFGLQSIVGNIISGLVIAFSRPFVVGDILEFGDERGKVKEISLRATVISTTDEADLLIPNNTLMSSNLKNWTISGKQRYVSIKLYVAHGSDPEKVIELIRESLLEQKEVVSHKSFVNFTGITDIGLEFSIRYYILDLTTREMINTQLLLLIISKFHKNKIKLAKRFSSEDD
jgi:small-conductance mechanosensitive channel